MIVKADRMAVFRQLVLEHAVDGALILTFLDTLALIELLLATANGDNHLGQAALVDKQAQRNNRESWLHGVLGDMTNLLAVEQ